MFNKKKKTEPTLENQQPAAESAPENPQETAQVAAGDQAMANVTAGGEPAAGDQPAENGAAGAQPEKEVQFEKNIKTLWIYTTLFCLFALVLIVVSSIIQGRIDSRAEYYQDRYENAQSSSQSTIKNIQDENAALKKDLESYKAKSELLDSRTAQDEKLINNAAALIQNADLLISAQEYVQSGKRNDARECLRKVDADILSQTMREVYDSLRERLD